MTPNRAHQLGEYRTHRHQLSLPRQRSHRQAPNSPRSPHLPLCGDGDLRIPKIHPVMILQVLLTLPPAHRIQCCQCSRHPLLPHL